MIIITYPTNNRGVASSWKARLDQLVVSHQLVEDNNVKVPFLSDGSQQTEGVDAIDSHIDKLEQLVAGWYKDRCDKYEFDPDEKALKL